MNKLIPFKKLIFNIVFAFIITLSFFIINWIFIPFTFTISNLFHRDNFLIVYLIILAGTFIKQKGWAIAYYAFLVILLYIELLHISYYGNVIFSSEVWIFFSEFNEISDAFDYETLKLFIKPTIAIIILVAIILGYIIKLKHLTISNKYTIVLIFIAFIIWPTSIYVNKRRVGAMPPIDQHIIRSGLETFAGFFGDVLPRKLNRSIRKKTVVKTPPPEKNINANIILVIGESLNPKHMSLFGYNVKTTPRLDSLYQNNVINKNKAIALGICTYTSLANFFNLIDTLDSESQIFSQNTSLFKLAKQNNFKTYFISSQSSEGLSRIYNILGTKYLDVYKTAFQLNPKLDDSTPCFDIEILKELKKIDLNTGNNFIVLQQYGSHENYNERYPEKYDIFTPEDYSYAKTCYYDNSVYYTDFVLSEIIKYLQKNTQKPTYFIYISDHSEEAGDNNTFGHCMIRKDVIEVPVIYTAFNTTDNPFSLLDNKKITPASNIAKIIANLLGYNYKLTFNDTAYVTGLELDGSGGYYLIEYNDTTVTKIKPIK